MANGRKTGGRSAGTPNKFSADLRAMILAALDGAGGEAYLQHQAIENPNAFLTLLGKVIAHGRNRDHALDRLDRGLAHLVVEGVPTTVELLRAVLAADGFRADRHHTRWVEDEFLPEWKGAPSA